MTSDNSESRLPPPADDQYPRCSFSSSVHVVNLQRASLSRKFDRAQCLLARDDTASVNLYVDHRKELDFLTFRLTHGIRQVYINKKARSVKIHLSNQQRLDVTLDSEDQCQSFYDQVARVKEKPNDSDAFPRHQPKIGIEQRPDPNAAYLTAKDTPTGLARSSAAAAVPTVPSTPVKRKLATQRPTMILEQTHKKACKDQPAAGAFSTYRQSTESRGSMMSDSPVSSEPTPDRWRFPSSPIYLDDEAMTPSKSTSLTQAIGQFEKFGRVDSLPTTPLQRPQFHAIVPTPRVLRSMRSTTKRYGCEVESRKSKNALLQDRSSGSKCISAVLQALFCLDPVSKLLQEPSWIRLSGSQHGIFRSLVDSYSHHVKSNTLAVEDEVVSHSVTKNSKGSLGDDQDDAREFLKDCLGQLRREFQGRSVDRGCPLSKVFDCQVEDILVCTSCGNQTIRTEHYQDFCLELPMVDHNRSTQQSMSLGSLVPQVFDTRQTALACEICLAENATVHRAISKLPTVLVLYLKRFSSKPTQGYNKNRSLVGIDETLEFTQFCSPEAFTVASTASTHGLCSDDDLLNDHPQIPSDSFPSSSSSRFSSASPGRLDHFWSSSPPQPLEDDYIDLDLYDPLQLNSAADPIIVISDDEDQTVTPANESFSFFDEPSEEEQYRWAIEESLRASQTSSQELPLDQEGRIEGKAQDLTEASSRIFDPLDPRVKDIRLKSVEGPYRHTIHVYPSDKNNTTLPAATSTHDNHSTTTQHGFEKQMGPKRDESDFFDLGSEEDEEEDESLKAAIRASLMGSESRPLTEEELQEQESKQVQEAIDKSLRDQEDNKENISPEQKRGGKKGKKDKNENNSSNKTTTIAGLTRSCTQSRIPDLMDSSTKDGSIVSMPAQLRRANTIDVNGRMRPHPKSVDQSSQTLSNSQPIPPRRPTRSSSFMRTFTEDANGPSMGVAEEQSCSRPSRSFADPSADAVEDEFLTKSSSRAAKGKDKAPKKTGVHTVGDDHLGLFRLQATVSHTGLVTTATTTSEGYYVCDRRGADGIWRCQDGTRRTKIGSISDLNKQRGRSGYLFFYVRCRVEDAVVL
ncbi:Ubiquitin carboxyl-terminal hydrolase 26 [Mortierella alpina]|nr:Ubiquitin carboxyl-terminal hydrolase 26 [Mortierella alpina]